MNLRSVETIDDLLAFAELAHTYQQVRAEHPRLPARTALAAVRYHQHAGDHSLEQAVCAMTGGHDWSHGYDDSDHDIPIYCHNCGISGDI